MRKKISLCVFSKDRPVQLRLLLESLQANAKDLFDITVLCKSSNERFELGYQILFDECCVNDDLPPIRIIDEEVYDSFKEGVLNIIDSSENELFAFATDDAIFYRNIYDFIENPFDEIFNILKKQGIFCYSLRMGLNISKSNYHTNRTFTFFPREIIENTFLFKFDEVPDFYPFSLDFHIYEKDRLRHWILLTDKMHEKLTGRTFTSPNYLEGNTATFNYLFKYLFLGCPKKSVVFCNSINRTQDIFQNYAGGKYPMTIEKLNDKYLSGEVIDFKKLEFGNIQSTHDEIQLVWKTL